MEIILIRHGKPLTATNPIVNALGYVKWLKNYQLSQVSNCSKPSIKDTEQYKSYFVVSSDLNRAMHSAHIFTGNPPTRIEKLLREVELPRYKLPLYLPAMVWLYLCRIFWLLGFKGHVETYKQSKIRSIRAALTLIQLAKQEDKVVVFGHGLINRFIRNTLIKKGWNLTSTNSNYWGVTQLKYAGVNAYNV